MSAPQDTDSLSHSPRSIRFTKASACGNDFLIVDAASVSGDLSAITRRLCDRHNGVGADGVEWLYAGVEADVKVDVRARLINADGSEAEISGNGTRCVAAEICSRKPEKKEVVVRTGAGLKRCCLISKSKEGLTFEFETDMGRPDLGGELSVETTLKTTMGTELISATGTRVSMGNPHFVIFVKGCVDDFQKGWQRQAAAIAAQPQFPEGTNVEYVVTRDNNTIEIRLFERGVGETQSSGTGSCAAAVAAIASGRVKSPVKVIAPGGSQTVRWDNEVYLRGPAILVCRGEFFV